MRHGLAAHILEFGIFWAGRTGDDNGLSLLSEIGSQMSALEGSLGPWNPQHHRLSYNLIYNCLLDSIFLLGSGGGGDS